MRKKFAQESRHKFQQYWGGYEHLTFWNCGKDDDRVKVIAELRAGINASSYNNYAKHARHEDPPWSRPASTTMKRKRHERGARKREARDWAKLESQMERA